jgi:predicted nucleic acid-binding protein
VLLFFDTSVLVKLYIEELGSSSVRRAAGLTGRQLALSQVGELEFRAALRARQRCGNLGQIQADAILEHFMARVVGIWIRQPITETVISLSSRLLDIYPLRAPDAMQLASAVALQQWRPEAGLRFVCSDTVLLKAAAAQGLPCWDPAAEELEPG